ncbi:23 kDa integral membrane protein-like [Babylonia areolata]|uniref:23 kDa integral membrane protein-like n=1 Tax=Babylonia areolata TaxID=304850 RepID=UPI003FD55D3F
MAGFWTNFGRFILIVLNGALLLVSLAILASGVILKFFKESFLDDVLGSLDFEALSNQTQVDFGLWGDIEQILELPFLDEVAVVLMAVGGVMLVLTFLPCCGACCMWRPLLVLFVFLMVLQLICQLALGTMFLVKDSPMHNVIKQQVGDKVKYDFDADLEDSFSYTIAILNYKLGCCGIRGKDDFPNHRPPSCCNNTIIDGDQSWHWAQDMCLETPPTAPDAFYNQKGCYTVLQERILADITTPAAVFAGVLFAQLLEVIFACLLIKELNDRNKVSPY